MNRFYGKIGYGESLETPTGSGVWVDNIIERFYFGDVIRNTKRLETRETLNDNIVVGNSISIVSDDYAIKNFSTIKYVFLGDIAWTVSSVEVKTPRLILTLDEVYNGPFPEEDP